MVNKELLAANGIRISSIDNSVEAEVVETGAAQNGSSKDDACPAVAVAV